MVNVTETTADSQDLLRRPIVLKPAPTGDHYRQAFLPCEADGIATIECLERFYCSFHAVIGNRNAARNTRMD
jgi:hypothetical protein